MTEGWEVSVRVKLIPYVPMTGVSLAEHIQE